MALKLALAALASEDALTPEDPLTSEDKGQAPAPIVAAVTTPPRLNSEKLTALILDHQEHGKRLAWSFLTNWRVRMKQDEVLSIVGAALCEAALRFDDTRGVAFKTFFFYHLRGMLLKEISRFINEQRVLQLLPPNVMSDFALNNGNGTTMMPTIEQNNPERLLERRQIADMCRAACEQLDSLEREVILRHYVHDQPLIDIAEELEYCRCHISRVKSRALAKLGQLVRPQLRGEAKQPLKSEKTRISRTPKSRAGYTGGRGRRRGSRAQKTA